MLPCADDFDNLKKFKVTVPVNGDDVRTPVTCDLRNGDHVSSNNDASLTKREGAAGRNHLPYLQLTGRGTQPPFLMFTLV